MSVHKTDRKTSPYVARWRDEDGRNRSKSFATRQEATAFEREMRQIKRRSDEGAMIKKAVEIATAEVGDSPGELRAAARLLRALAGADWDGVTAGDLRVMRVQNRTADEFDRRADELEAS
jgi:hypothetical protein